MTFHGRSHARAAGLPMRIGVSVLAILALGIASVSSSVPQAMGQDIPEVVGRVKPSVAFVFASGDQFKGSGSAFVVDTSGLLVTALHVVEDANRVSVVLPGKEPELADVMEFDSDNDLALLRINQSNLSPLALGDSDALRSGEEIIVIGYPLADALGTYDVTVTKGIISAIRPRSGPGNPPPHDDPVIAAAKAQIAATIRKQLLDLYQTQGLDALLARLRTSPAGDDLGTQTIRAERQRLLDIYEWGGPDALIAELRK